MEFNKGTPPHSGEKIRRIVAGVEKPGQFPLVRFTEDIDDNKEWMKEQISKGREEMSETSIKDHVASKGYKSIVVIKRIRFSSVPPKPKPRPKPKPIPKPKIRCPRCGHRFNV